MADVTNELIYEVLKQVQTEVSAVRHDVRELKTGVARIERELHSIRGDLLRQAEGMAGLEVRMDRMETRLGLRDS